MTTTGAKDKKAQFANSELVVLRAYRSGRVRRALAAHADVLITSLEG